MLESELAQNTPGPAERDLALESAYVRMQVSWESTPENCGKQVEIVAKKSAMECRFACEVDSKERGNWEDPKDFGKIHKGF